MPASLILVGCPLEGRLAVINLNYGVTPWPGTIALVAQWIERVASDHKARVRFLPGVLI